jgi:hypothetical protein
MYCLEHKKNNFASGVEIDGYVAKSFPPGQLRKGHADQLLSASEMPNFALRVVALDQTGVSLPVDQIKDLEKNVAARVHCRVFSKNVAQSLNPSHPFLLATHLS